MAQVTLVSDGLEWTPPLQDGWDLRLPSHLKYLQAIHAQDRHDKGNDSYSDALILCQMN
jgi:hypothetical protein